jgi:CBS domain containing-hemolysin-like protein
MDSLMNDPEPDPAHPAFRPSQPSPATPLAPPVRVRTLFQRVIRSLQRVRREANPVNKQPPRFSSAMAMQDELPDSRILDKLTVSELMRPAHEMVYLSATHDWQHNLDVIQRTRFSRYPYFADDGETLMGMVHFKDLFPSGGREVNFQSILRKALVVAPDTPVPDLFRRFRQGASHFALVGYPGEHPEGFLTIDNLLGAMLGEIRDEFRHDGGNWTLRDDGSLMGKGSMSLFSLKRALHIELPDLEVDSVGGLVMRQLGRLPNEGERIGFSHFDIVIKRMQGPRILLLKIKPKVAGHPG